MVSAVHQRHPVCQTCLRVNKSFSKKLKLGTDPGHNAFNLEECLQCSQRARAAARELRLKGQQDAGDEEAESCSASAQQAQLRPRRLFLKDAFAAAPLDLNVVGPVVAPTEGSISGSGVDTGSAQDLAYQERLPPPSPKAAQLPAHALPMTPWRVPAVPPTPGAPGSIRRSKSGEIARPRPLRSSSGGVDEQDTGAEAPNVEAHTPGTQDGWGSPRRTSRGSPPEAPPPAPGDGKQALRRAATAVDVADLTSGLCGISLGKRTLDQLCG